MHYYIKRHVKYVLDACSMSSGMLFQFSWNHVPTYLEQESNLAVPKRELKKLTTRAYRVRLEFIQVEYRKLDGMKVETFMQRASSKAELERGHSVGNLCSTSSYSSNLSAKWDKEVSEAMLLLNYKSNNHGADVQIWQRQKLIADWFSTKGDKNEEKREVHVGDINLTSQTNSVTFHIRKNGNANKLELMLITLERINEPK